jgi:hypothetical protein
MKNLFNFIINFCSSEREQLFHTHIFQLIRLLVKNDRILHIYLSYLTFSVLCWKIHDNLQVNNKSKTKHQKTDLISIYEWNDDIWIRLR